MSELNLPEAFARYSVKSTTRARSALTADRALVLSCFYERFHKSERGVLKYEEDLSGDNGSTATLLRGHLSEALESELDVRLIIATSVQRPPSLQAPGVPQPGRANFHARQDLVGRVTFFDGSRFVVEFRRVSDTD